jgi:hypothetical protein
MYEITQATMYKVLDFCQYCRCRATSRIATLSRGAVRYVAKCRLVSSLRNYYLGETDLVMALMVDLFNQIARLEFQGEC